MHDYFFAKTLDKVKDGGIIAYVTSKGTLDKKDESVRRYLAEHADLIGAIRLPNNAFKANANTEVTTDIIFLQKRSSPPEREPEWVHLGKTEDGLPINSYYEQHPEMVLGQIVQGNKLYGHGQEDTMCVPIEGADLQEQLSIAVSKLSAEISDEKANEVFKRAENDVTPPEDLRNYSLFQSGDKIYFKSSHGSAEMKFNSSNTLYNHARAFIALRDCTRELLSAQERNASDEDILALQKQLNTLYDDFYSKYGLINSRKNQKHFGEDISYHLLCSLEKRYDKDVLLEKSDIFTKRTVKPAQPVTHVDNTLDALALSVVEKARVDLDYIESLTGIQKDSIISSLKGEIYPVPYSNGEYQTASEYLSGDIYQKLLTARAAAEKDSKFMDNVKALEEVMPEPVKAGDIEVHIGATWIDPKYYELFMYETFDTPKNLRNDIPSHMSGKAKKISVEYIADINQYNVINKTLDSSVTATKAYGTDKINAYEIMNYILNMRDPKVTKIEKDSYGHEKRVIDIAATKIAQKKADKIRSAFADWIFKDPERREELVQTYNNTFNCIRPRQYNGSALSFPGMSVDVQLHEHQKDAIAHALFGGNTLFAHSVGAGKTYEMIAAAMESKRLGLCSKTLMVVPNHLTEQVGSDFLKLYPNANILVASKNDFKKENRQALFGKIATGNFDAIIIGHSQLKMIPMSKERQEQILNSQINDVILGIEYLKANGGSGMSIKQMIRTKMRLEKALNELKAKEQDDITTFEEMGIDKLIVDEAHEFKNLFTPTKLQNMSGISQTASQKAQDLFVKAQFLNEKTGGKGLILATGTPLSNSVTELHTMMRYLEYDFLKEKHLDYFDNFISVFGERKTDWELAPAGNKFKLRTRIANYNGMPELMSMFKQVADVRTADTLDLDVPKCETHIINVEPTEFQQTLVQELADRADAIQHDNIDPSVDNMLSITSDGRKLGLDPRLIDPSYDDEPQTKLNQCVDNVYKIYEDTAAERLTQIIFCDLGVPHGSSSSKSDNSSSEEKSVSEQNSLEEECDFCIYDDIKKKLVNKGVLPEEIAYIHDAKTEIQKAELFEKVRNGEVRVLLGSTAKMGTGTNVQDKLIAIHDLDIPWRPADLEQRKGRMVRQGNQNSTVHLYRYVTKGTFDAYSYQTLEAKQKFISQIMTSKSPVRKCEDIDQQSLTYAEIKTLCTGDERIKEKMQLDNDVKELRLLKAEYTNVKHEMEDKIRNAPSKESLLVSEISNLERDIKHIRSISEDDFSITIKGNTYIDRTEAAKALEQATFSAVANALNTNIPIGEFKGFPLSVSMRSDSKVIRATLSGSAPHIIEFGVSYSNNIKRMENSLYKLEEVLQNKKYELSSLRYDVSEAKKIIEQPFAQEAELEEKSQRLETLSDELIKAAMESKSNQKTKSRTNYFSCAKLKREAAKLKAAQGKTPKKDKKIGLGGDAMGTGTDDNSL